MKPEAVYFWAYHFKKFWKEKAPYNVWNWYALYSCIESAKSPYDIFNDWTNIRKVHPLEEEWYCIVDNLLEEMNRK